LTNVGSDESTALAGWARVTTEMALNKVAIPTNKRETRDVALFGKSR